MLKVTDHETYSSTAEIVSNYNQIRRRLHGKAKPIHRPPQLTIVKEPEPDRTELSTHIDFSVEIIKIKREFANLHDRLATLSAAVAEALPPEGHHTSTSIKRAVAAQYAGMTSVALEGHARMAPLTDARMIAIALTHRFTNHSMSQIGRLFDGRDHTTIIYTLRRMRPILEAAEQALPEGAPLAEWVRWMKEHGGKHAKAPA